MAYEVKDKVFFVTGAATGIGAVTVRNFVKEGARFVAIFDVNEKDGVALENELNSKYGEKTKFIKGDVTDEKLFKDSLKSVKEAKGLDVLINNAGIMNDSMYKKEIDINLSALITGTLKAIEIMRKDDGGNGGTVINIASVAGLCQTPLLPVYWATKCAVIQFSNCIGMDDYYIRTGVRVVAVCYGRTETPLLHEENLKSFDKQVESTFQERFNEFPSQTPESAGKGLVETYKQASSGSTWLVSSGRPAEDISADVKKGYEVMSAKIYT